MNTTNHSDTLVDGNIPAGKPCPFLNECHAKHEHCPTMDKPHNNAFSCALARAFKMIKWSEARK